MATTTIRTEVDAMSADELAALRDGYSKMMAISDNRGWIYWAGIHGYPSGDCWHHNKVGFSNKTYPYNLFLPWHRAYMMNFEQTVKDQNEAAALPWWDWTSAASHATGIPSAYSQAIAGGNPLQSGPKPKTPGDPTVHTVRKPHTPAQLPTDADVQQALAATTFEDFTAAVENLHDGVHGWVGGHMGVIQTAAFDPIFYAHHCMIDRLWYLWQLQHGVSNIPPNYVDLPLAPFSLKVSDVLDVSSLGYMYAVAQVTVPTGM